MDTKHEENPASFSNEISDQTGHLDVRFALWRKFCSESGVSVESLPSELSEEAKAEWEKVKETGLVMDSE